MFPESSNYNRAWRRREFLAVTATSAVAMAFTACSRLPTTQPEDCVVDSHTHFYDPARPQGVPWPPPNQPLLYRTVLPADYRALSTSQRITATVVVEASPWIEDNQWLLDLAARDPFIVGIVGNLPVGRPGFAPHLKRFAANPIFRGIRIRNRELEGTLQDPTFFADLKRVADLDLSLDLVGGREILAYADSLAIRLPGLRIVIDHLAGLRVDGKAPPSEWFDAMHRLVRHPNVYLKVSGLVEGTGRANGTAPGDVGFYAPVLDALRGMFGAERLIYASNWPVSELFAPLSTVENIIKTYFDAHGPHATRHVFCRSSAAAYRWRWRHPTGR